MCIHSTNLIVTPTTTCNNNFTLKYENFYFEKPKLSKGFDSLERF